MARRLLGCLLVAALGVAVVVQARAHPGESAGGAGAGALALELAAGLGACAAGAYLALRRAPSPASVLLAASGIAVLLGSLPLPEAGGAVLFTAALAGGAFAAPLAGAAAACHPEAGRAGALAAGVTVTAIAVFGVLAAAVFDPAATGCFACPDNLLLVHGDAGLYERLANATPQVLTGLCAGLAVLATARWARRPSLVRRAAAPVALGGALVAAVGAVDARTPSRTLWLAQCAVLALAAAAVGLQALRARALRGRIADIVVRTLASPERLRAALADGLGDPALTIDYPGAGADGGGGPGRATTGVTRAGEVVALLHHSAGLPPERVAAAARAAAPALEHAALRARLRADLAELRASRLRIVEVGDEERMRVERDLHDGAQQRLIALSMALPPGRAADEVRGALADLRTLAHGIHPAALTEAGVAAALAELRERSRVPVRLEVAQRRWPAAVEAALYRLVLDGIVCAERAGDGGTVEVTITGAARADLLLPGVDVRVAAHALQHAHDRAAALDGLLTLGPGAHVEACLPCAS
jgi:signal transduction histidine kinase